MTWLRKVVAKTAIGLIVAATIGATAYADTISLAATKDNTIYSESEYTNGGGQYFFAGLNDQGGERRALIAFDVARAVPASSTIQSISITLHVSRTNPHASPITVSFYRLTSDWGEGTAVGPLGEGGGAPPGPGDATWSYDFYNTTRWNMPGADGDRVLTASANGLVPNDIAFHTWQSTPALVADVQYWLDSPNSNFGWQLIGTATPTSAKRFDSRENTNPAFRPVLEIVYTPPMAGDGGLPDSGVPDAGEIDGGLDSGSTGPDAGLGTPDVGGADGGASNGVSSSTSLTRGRGCYSATGSFASLACLWMLFLINSRFLSKRQNQ